MAGIVVRPYEASFVQDRAVPSSLPEGSAPISAFMPTLPNDVRQIDGSGAALEKAGAQLEKGSDNASIIALGMMKDANETAVQDLNNKFITGSQALLYTGDDAFYKKQGKDAIDGAPGATAALQDLQKSLIDQVSGNQAVKDRITAITNGHISSATNDISRQVAVQGLNYQKSVLQAGQENIVTQSRLDNQDFDKVNGLADAAAANAIKGLEIQGLKGDPDATKAAVTKARSAVYGSAVDQMVQEGNGRRALSFYNNIKGQLDGPTNDRLSAKMKSVEADVSSDDYITKATMPATLGDNVTKWAPKVYDAANKWGVDPTLALAVLKQESDGNERAEGKPTAYGTAKGLMQVIDSTAKGLGITDSYNADQNIDGGVRHLSEMMAVFKDQRLALMAYNWGDGNVKNWLAKGADPSKIPDETRDYLAKVQGYQAAQTVGYDKANMEGLIQKASTDPSLDATTRSAVVAKLTKQSATTEAARSATKKNIDEGFAATTQLMMVAPDKVAPGALAKFGEAYAASGFPAEAVNAQVVASMESTLRNFSSAPKDAQEEQLRAIVKGLLPGQAKALAEGFSSADTKVRTDAGKQAAQEFDGLKTAAANKVDIPTLEPKAKKAVDLAIQAKDYPKAQEIADFWAGHVVAQAVGQAPPTQQTAAIEEMRTKIEKGAQDNATIVQLDTMRKTQQAQEGEFAKDAYAAGTALYPQVGKPAPVDFNNPDPAALGMRAAQATQISALRNNMPVLPFSQDEMASLRNKLDAAPPDQQAKIMVGLSSLPADQLPRVAAALAGKKDAADPTSQAYAAALAFFAEKDPARAAVANQILQGAQLIRAGGEGGIKPAVTSDAWQQEKQNLIGTALKDLSPETQATIGSAIGAHYTYLMRASGRQGDKTDTDILDKSVKAVLGDTISYNGQSFYPPVRGMDRYGFENNVVGRLTNGDVDGIRTKEGSPVTADLIRRAGVFTNVADGLYMVRVPDPRNGGIPGELELPAGQRNKLGGNAYLLDAKDMLQRVPAGSSRDPNAPDYVAAPSIGGVR